MAISPTMEIELKRLHAALREEAHFMSVLGHQDYATLFNGLARVVQTVLGPPPPDHPHEMIPVSKEMLTRLREDRAVIGNFDEG